MAETMEASAQKRERRCEEEDESRPNQASAGEAKPEEPISIVLSDLTALDCSACGNPLTIPVLQCKDGHTMCSRCRTIHGEQCAACGETALVRCRAIDRVLVSAKTACFYRSHGCRAIFKYSDKVSHESTCSYAPYACPFQTCNFRCLPEMIHKHLDEEHRDDTVHFAFNHFFEVMLEKNVKFSIGPGQCLILREIRGVLFSISYLNNSIAIRCFESSGSGNGKYAFAVMCGIEQTRQWFQSFTNSAIDDTPPKNLLHISPDFFDARGLLQLEICIWERDAIGTRFNVCLDRFRYRAIRLADRGSSGSPLNFDELL